MATSSLLALSAMHWLNMRVKYARLNWYLQFEKSPTKPQSKASVTCAPCKHACSQRHMCTLQTCMQPSSTAAECMVLTWM